LPDLVDLGPGTFRYRDAADLWRDGRPASAPLETQTFATSLRIMRRQVTAADYQRCVAANACLAIDEDALPDRAVVKVSWRDAEAYATWLSRSTGLAFRLPSDREWAYAAGSRFNAEAGPSADDADPGRRALALYDQDAKRAADRRAGNRPDNRPGDRDSGRDPDPLAGLVVGFGKTPQPIGTFGANEHGLLDVAGNVWEWTDTCFVRTSLNAQGAVEANVVNCGIRLVEGRHRAYMPDFIRDARAGGCSVGTPPSAIGFRLVLDATR
jgi:formylglycine-generating enzyme required for sulfatase activity